MRDTIILGIETSCDETSASIVRNGREVLSNIINSQVDIHTIYGGVVPEIASRAHTECISQVAELAVSKAGIKLSDIDVVSATYGPGLIGALLVGVSYAKGLSYSMGRPLIGVNHIEGHIASNYITHKELEPPFLCLIISGGHTHLVYVKDYTEFEILGKTRDDAIGETFDKVARVIGIPYPGGPKIDELAKDGAPSIDLPKSNMSDFDFSYSGLKTAIINLYHKNPDVNHADLCSSFQKVATEMLMEKTISAIKKMRINKLVLCRTE